MKVLHISNWFPTRSKPYSAQWIRDHIQALEIQGIENDVIHFEVKKSRRFGWRSRIEPFGNRSITWGLPIFSWKIAELLHFFFLLWLFILRKEHRKYDIINFHIAYPQLVYWHLLKGFVDKRIIITEHWSAYHFHFNLPVDSKNLVPIRRIFRQGIPLISVSHSLLKDIKTFSKSDFQGYVVPNVVDVTQFRQTEIGRKNSFFMVSLWAFPKDPLLVLEAFTQFIEWYPDYQLRIGGYGELEEEIKSKIKLIGLENNVIWLGSVTKEEIAMELNLAKAFIHCSHYETFSVVCAEAVTCGCPVIASHVGGIPEVVPKEGNYLVENEPVNFLNAMKKCVLADYRPKPTDYYALSNVGREYAKVLAAVNAEK